VEPMSTRRYASLLQVEDVLLLLLMVASAERHRLEDPQGRHTAPDSFAKGLSCFCEVCLPFDPSRSL